MRKICYGIVIIALGFISTDTWAACGGSTLSCGAKCIEAYDAGRDCVAEAISQIDEDDITLRVPAGNATWPTPVTLPADYSWVLEGAGAGNTVITAAGNALVIVPDMPAKTGRITGFEFHGPAGDGINAYLLRGTNFSSNNRCVSMRVDSNKFVDCKAGQTAGCIRTGGVCGWVIDSNIFKSTSGAYKNCIDVNQPDDGSWSTPLDLGGPDAVYIEDNYFEIAPNARYLLDGSEHNWLHIDSTSGGRYVARYNVFKNGYVSNHGTCYNSNSRGNLKAEIYRNWIYHTGNGDCGGSSCDLWNPISALSGTGVVYQNVIQGEIGAADRWIAFQNNRSDSDSCNFAGQCDGTNPIDENQIPLASYYGYKCYDQPGTGPNQGAYPWYIWENKSSATVSNPALDCESNPKGCYEQAYADIGNADISSVAVDGSRFADFHFLLGRDFFMSAHPSWAEYPYPHPLRGASSSDNPDPATNSNGGSGCFMDALQSNCKWRDRDLKLNF